MAVDISGQLFQQGISQFGSGIAGGIEKRQEIKAEQLQKFEKNKAEVLQLDETFQVLQRRGSVSAEDVDRFLVANVAGKRAIVSGAFTELKLADQALQTQKTQGDIAAQESQQEFFKAKADLSETDRGAFATFDATGEIDPNASAETQKFLFGVKEKRDIADAEIINEGKSRDAILSILKRRGVPDKSIAELSALPLSDLKAAIPLLPEMQRAGFEGQLDADGNMVFKFGGPAGETISTTSGKQSQLLAGRIVEDQLLNALDALQPGDVGVKAVVKEGIARTAGQIDEKFVDKGMIRRRTSAKASLERVLQKFQTKGIITDKDAKRIINIIGDLGAFRSLPEMEARILGTLDAFGIEIGTLSDPRSPLPNQPDEATPAAQLEALQVGSTATDSATGIQYRYIGGDVKDPNSYEQVQ